MATFRLPRPRLRSNDITPYVRGVDAWGGLLFNAYFVACSTWRFDSLLFQCHRYTECEVIILKRNVSAFTWCKVYLCTQNIARSVCNRSWQYNNHPRDRSSDTGVLHKIGALNSNSVRQLPCRNVWSNISWKFAVSTFNIAKVIENKLA